VVDDDGFYVISRYRLYLRDCAKIIFTLVIFDLLRPLSRAARSSAAISGYFSARQGDATSLLPATNARPQHWRWERGFEQASRGVR